MTTADIYRLKDADLRTLANRDTANRDKNAGLRREHKRLARNYLRLVEHAERNIRTDAQSVPGRFSARKNREKNVDAEISDDSGRGIHI